MSVIMTFRAKGDPSELERRAGENPELMKRIRDRAKEHGLIAHRFYGGQNGEIMVLDEWPDPDSFQAFFGEMREEIEPLMRDVGVTAEPEVIFWQKLETHDDYGWGA
jgi:hypothetical protein